MVKFFFSQNEYDMRFSEWLKTYRKAVGLSQDKLADKVNEIGKPFNFSITSAQISNYEREYDKDQEGNPTRPKEKFVELAAEVLQRPVAEAKLAANYAPDIKISPIRQPKTPAEFFEILEELGMEINLDGGIQTIESLDEDDLQDLLDSIVANAQAKARRKAKGK